MLYECILCDKCYNCSFSSYLIACSDADFCWDLSNCTNCFLCTGMQNAHYCILNEKLSPEKYHEKKKKLLENHSVKELLDMLNDLRRRVPQRMLFQKNSENCVGPDIRNSKNMFYSFAAKNSEDCMYTMRHVNNVKDSVDIECAAADPSEELYNCIGTSGVHNIMCCCVAWFSHDLYYCQQIWNSHDLLGCIARNHAEYEILNVKYPKEEYFKKKAEIEDQLRAEGLWGKIWFDSTYPYQDTLAALYYAE